MKKRAFTCFFLVMYYFPAIVFSQKNIPPDLRYNFPAELIAEKTYETKFILDKQNISGPARLKFGFSSVTPEILCVDCAGAEPVIKSNYFSLAWIQLPDDSLLQLRLRFIFHEKTSAGQLLQLAFSYNENGSSAEKLFQPSAYLVSPPYRVTAIRKINRISDNKFTVTVEMEKPAEGGFARLYEKFPPGFIAKVTAAENAWHKTENEMLKFSWDDFLPDKKNSVISYSLVSSASRSGFPEITGSFSAEFLEGENDNIPVITTEKNDLKSGAPENPVISPLQPEVVISPIPANTPVNSDTVFRIQIAASGSSISEGYFSRKYGFSEQVHAELIDGYHKYSVGHFSTFDEARKKRYELQMYPFKNPFIIALVNGKRVPVDQNRKK